ncbi:phosphoacetylglucosamine mutase-like [Haliotis cracherodii]|uniref:phosphoacetylglucosamine mutase-like n=1 Tax=Haliotis cracherodii TaxID=6455 RepID=UPI0039EA1E3D
MASLTQKASEVAREKHPRKQEKFLQYGTAGFRTKAEDLDHVIYRMGLLAVLASKARKATIGVMITASHNPEEDNGVKMIDTMGEMMPKQWEEYSTELANVSDEKIPEVLEKIIASEKIDMATEACVSYARDTRPSSASLAHALMEGIQALDGKFKDFGLLSTPQLHYIVCCQNTNGKYGAPTEDGYYQKLSSAFIKFKEMGGKEGAYQDTLYLDAANGVGAIKVQLILKHLNDTLRINLFNDGSSGKLNYQCGADFVKMQQTAPTGMTLEAGRKCISYDGDADRIMFFFQDQAGKFHMLDGDKQAALIAGYLQELATQSGLSLNLGLVQTAYANGNSTTYITEQMKVPIACVPTGVKHLHHKAKDFDVGIYFEANGHGTVIFNDKATDQILNAANSESSAEEQKLAAKRLSVLMDVINQTVGDAISDMLVVEAILFARGWSIEDWDKCYTDLPNRQLKVKVSDRTAITTADAERKVVTPAGLQGEVDKLVAGYTKGRSFVRPSGTEDVVRVYSEADTRESADSLAYEVGLKVYELAVGVGDKPVKP